MSDARKDDYGHSYASEPKRLDMQVRLHVQLTTLKSVISAIICSPDLTWEQTKDAIKAVIITHKMHKRELCAYAESAGINTSEF